ncbi:hypothetical protein [Nonomuraea sp. B19D2]|uniref:hypothetical protein n=1 Tax=Nonomuraea sp. B19D2 TaxID=3159561 RepID=UPI0032DB5FE7
MIAVRRSAALVALALTAACSAQAGNRQADDRVLRDPSKWPLAGLSTATATKDELPTDAERALARVRVGGHDLVAWIHTRGVCGLSEQGDSDGGWSLSTRLDEPGTTTTPEEGFAGPAEPAVVSGYGESEVILFCTPTRMLVKVKTKSTKVKLDGHAAAQVSGDGVSVVVGTPAARKESLPQATVEALQAGEVLRQIVLAGNWRAERAGFWGSKGGGAPLGGAV